MSRDWARLRSVTAPRCGAQRPTPLPVPRWQDRTSRRSVATARSRPALRVLGGLPGEVGAGVVSDPPTDPDRDGVSPRSLAEHGVRATFPRRGEAGPDHGNPPRRATFTRARHLVRSRRFGTITPLIGFSGPAYSGELLLPSLWCRQHRDLAETGYYATVTDPGVPSVVPGGFRIGAQGSSDLSTTSAARVSTRRIPAWPPPTSALHDADRLIVASPPAGSAASPTPTPAAPRPRRSSWPGPARPKAEPARPAGRLPGTARGDRPGRATAPQGGGGRGRERLRGPDGGGPALLAGPDQRGVLRGRRAVRA